jgi:hypothetical protein
MKKMTGGIWVAALGALTAVCLLVGLIAVFVALGQNGGCEVGQFTPDGEGGWQPCSAVNPNLVWGGALSVVGLVLAGFTGLAGAVVAVLAVSPRDR